MTELRARWSVQSNRDRNLSLVLVVTDLLCIVVAALVAGFLRNTLDFFRPTLDIVENVQGAAVILVVTWMVFLFLGGAYRARRTGVGTSEYTTVLNWSLIAAGATAMTLYLTAYDLSRGFFLLLFAVGTPLLLIVRYAVRKVAHTLRARGYNHVELLIAGPSRRVDRVVRSLRRERWLGYDIVGALVTDADGPTTPGGLPVIGRPSDAVEAVRAAGAYGVLFTEGSFDAPGEFNEMARQLEDHRAQMIVVPALADISAGRLDVRPIAGMPLVYVDSPRARQAGSWAKRLFDFVGASLLIVLLSPLMAITAIAVKRSDPGPVLFKQRRVGLKGDEFECLKFRSMVVDAEERLRALEQQNEGAGVLFKMKDDPRITKVGHFIRRYSIDELPQLFNVWRGEMSLSGPRPALPAEVARYSSDVMRRLDVRPGMTGLWQVSGRSDLSWEDTVRLDLYYVDNWSMLQDVQILGRTLGAVLRSQGAY